VRGFSEKTRNDYIRNVRAFAAFVGRSSDIWRDTLLFHIEGKICLVELLGDMPDINLIGAVATNGTIDRYSLNCSRMPARTLPEARAAEHACNQELPRRCGGGPTEDTGCQAKRRGLCYRHNTKTPIESWQIGPGDRAA
jgi:hypothetical protein